MLVNESVLNNFSHRRYNILTGEWVLVSPHRSKRPWQGKVEDAAPAEKLSYDPQCYLCPGNSRAGGKLNPQYSNTFVFENDFSALTFNSPVESINNNELFVAHSEQGICKVICFSPRHDLTLADMQKDKIKNVIDVWIDEYKSLGADKNINYVQIFENRGEIMGASNPHPHGQIWAQQTIPVEPVKESAMMKRHFLKNNSSLLFDYLNLELESGERVVNQNKHFVTLVPFWAVWPYEVIIISRRHVKNICELSEEEKFFFAESLKTITGKYNRIFKVPFPYSAGIHQSPTDGDDHSGWHMHMHFYPPLLRSASIKKFMVGYEMLANPQRDITPEESAERLRKV